MNIKAKLCVITLLIASVTIGCAIKFKPYKSFVGLEPETKIKVNAYVEVKAPKGYKIIPETIEKAIIKDLKENIFPYLTAYNLSEILVKVDVKHLKFSEQPWGLLWAPLCYIGAPLAKFIGETEVSLKIISLKDKSTLAMYEAEVKVEKWWGFYYGWKYGIKIGGGILRFALKEAMEDIKRQIIRDRNMLVAEIEKRRIEVAKEIKYDFTPPKITIIKPKIKRGISVVAKGYKTEIIGMALDPSGVVFVKVNERRVKLEPIEGGVMFSTEVLLSLGENKINIEAQDTRGNIGTFSFTLARVETEKEKEVVSIPKPKHETLIKPTLWVLSVGVSNYKNTNLNLRYADHDAEKIAKAFKAQKGKLYDDVFTKVLVNRHVTRESVLMAMKEFLGKASFHDVVIIFIAGHGVKDKRTDTYYFLPYDAEPENLFIKGLPWTDFDRAVRVISQNVSKVILLFDTCHAGAMKVAMRGAEAGEELAQALKSAEGMFILASAKPGEEAEESSRYKFPGEVRGHGAFTYMILKGLGGEADLDRDRAITVAELFTYVAKYVPRLAPGQHPYIRSSGEDFPLWMIGD